MASPVVPHFGSRPTALDVLKGVDLSGKFAVVTGANSGIGLETARALALHGAHVTMACRDIKKAKRVQEKIESECKDGKTDLMHVDLSSLKSVKRFADEFKAKNRPLDLLILNAGIMPSTHAYTDDGIECTFQTNHVSGFYLTQRLTDVLLKSECARLIVVSSKLHKQPSLKVSDIVVDKLSVDASQFGFFKTYGSSKLCNVLFAKEFHNRYNDKGIASCSLHPGIVSTDIVRELGLPKFISTLSRLFMKSPEQGAATSVFCAVTPDLLSGGYYDNCHLSCASKSGRDDDLAKALWDLTEKLIREKTETVD